MDYFTINSERKENDRVLQNLKVAMNQGNLATMRNAKAELDTRHDFYDTLSNNWSLWRGSRVDEWYRFVKEYNVLNAQLIAITKDLKTKQQLRQEAAAQKR